MYCVIIIKLLLLKRIRTLVYSICLQTTAKFKYMFTYTYWQYISTIYLY